MPSAPFCKVLYFFTCICTRMEGACVRVLVDLFRLGDEPLVSFVCE